MMRKTKIIATIGPSTRSPEKLKELIEAGCNVIRINMSHSTQEYAEALIADIRAISDEVGILVDTKGPEVRTTQTQGPILLEEGKEVLIRGEAGESNADIIRVSYLALPQVLDVGTRVLINDGQIDLRVEKVEPGQLRCRIIRGGTYSSRKGVNIPGVKLPMPFLSEQDASDITFAVRQNADFIAASFVGDVADVMQVRKLIERENGKTLIISKIESDYAVNNLDDIIAVSDGVMVARGDLGVEIPLENVPVVQKRMIKSCISMGKTVIVATEMLESMINNPRPTRAETSDVANAIFEGADAVMLSGETGVGKYPIDTVKTMSRIAEIAENEVRKNPKLPPNLQLTEVSELICKSAWLASTEANLVGILVPTSSGKTAKRMSRYRPSVPILATTPDMQVARSLSLSYGVYAKPAKHTFGRMESMVRKSCEVMIENHLLKKDDLIAIIAGVPVGISGTTNLLSIQHVSALLGKKHEENER
jgi:pyruvate kinase